MAMAPAAASRATASPASSRLIPKHSFLVPSLPQLPRCAGGGGNRAVLLGVGRRDGWGADNGSSSSEGGRLVDADMATLRRRIREAQAESAAEDDDVFYAEEDVDGAGFPLPTEWTELERRHHGSYVAGVRCAVALLEVLLINTRPGLGAGALAMVLLGVPASLFLVCAQLIQAGR